MAKAMRADEVKNYLNYDPDTGIFTWKPRPKNGRRSDPFAGKIAGSKDTHGYIRISINYTSYQAQILSWAYMTGEWPTKQIDHKNTIKDDNNWLNLRQASYNQNQYNQDKHKNNKSGYKGVFPRGKRWRSAIRYDSKYHYIGTFDTPEQAYEAYCEAAKELHGEFARI